MNHCDYITSYNFTFRLVSLSLSWLPPFDHAFSRVSLSGVRCDFVGLLGLMTAEMVNRPSSSEHGTSSSSSHHFPTIFPSIFSPYFLAISMAVPRCCHLVVLRNAFVDDGPLGIFVAGARPGLKIPGQPTITTKTWIIPIQHPKMVIVIIMVIMGI